MTQNEQNVPSIVTKALENFPGASDERRKTWDSWFEARDKEREARARVREEYNAKGFQDVLTERMGCLPATLKVIKALRELPPAVRVAVWAQASVIVADEKWDDERAIPEEERVQVVFDRTTTGRRMSTFRKPSERRGPGVLSRRGSPVLPVDLGERYFQEALQGFPIKPRRPGRPSADEQWAMDYAKAKLAKHRAEHGGEENAA